MTGLCRKLQQAGWFEQHQIAVPQMASFLDLVALGTVADVVPLDQTNRILVDQGIRRIRADETRPGIRALFEVAGRKQVLCQTQDFGFAIAPRLNAAGRLKDMSVGIECLLATDLVSATALAAELNRINVERRSIQAGMNDEAEEMVARLLCQLEGELPGAITLYEPDWHEGVIGIVAGRIKERFHRPVFVFAKAADGTLKGSGRSIAGVHIRDVLMDVVATRPGLLKKFGGHAMAAGVSLEPCDYDAFAEMFESCVMAKLNGCPPTREWVTDGELADDEICMDNARLMQFLQPWGQEFPTPTFDDIFHIESVRIVGGKHSKLQLRRASGKLALEAIAFNCQIDRSQSKEWRAVYRLDINHFRNVDSLQLVIDYIVPIQTRSL